MSVNELKTVIMLLGSFLGTISWLAFISIKMNEAFIITHAEELVKGGLRAWDLIPLPFAKFFSLMGILGGILVLVITSLSFLTITVTH